jgi:hypothetical protein
MRDWPRAQRLSRYRQSELRWRPTLSLNLEDRCQADCLGVLLLVPRGGRQYNTVYKGMNSKAVCLLLCTQ